MALRAKDYIPVEEAEDGTIGVAVFVQVKDRSYKFNNSLRRL